MTIQVDTLSLEPFSTGHEWLSQYVIGSFYFSQGDFSLQNYIDGYVIGSRPDLFRGLLKGTIEDPRYRIDEELFVTDTCHTITGIFNKGAHKPYDYKEVRTAVQDRWDTLHHILSGGYPLPGLQEILRLVFSGMLHREERYLLENPKPTKVFGQVVETRSSESNIRFGRSILLEHLIDEIGAHHPAFDDMFDSMRRQLPNIHRIDSDMLGLQKIEEKIAELNKRDPRAIAKIIDENRYKLYNKAKKE